MRNRFLPSTANVTLTLLLLAALTALPAWAEDENSQTNAVLTQYDSGQFEKAKHLCERLLAAHPKSLTGHYLLGNICVKLYQLPQAEAAYNFCLKGGKNSPEASYAYKALEQIYDQRRSLTSVQPASFGAPPVPTSGLNHRAEEKIQEETTRLQQDAKDQIAVKKRTLDDRIAQVKQEMSEAMYYAPRGRRSGYYRQEYQNQVKNDGQERISRLTKEFERQRDEINQSCQKRIDDLSEYEHNIESRSRR
jgi:predicted Zn-dependent protease